MITNDSTETTIYTYIVQEHEGMTREAVQASIIEADFDLIGLGLMDKEWWQFCRELEDRRGYSEVKMTQDGPEGYIAETWRTHETDYS